MDTLVALVITEETLMSSKTRWERGPVSPGCLMQQEWRRPVYEIKDASNVLDPAQPVQPYGKSPVALLSYQMLRWWTSAGLSPNTAGVMAWSLLSNMASVPAPWTWVPRACQLLASPLKSSFQKLCAYSACSDLAVNYRSCLWLCSVEGQESPGGQRRMLNDETDSRMYLS